MARTVLIGLARMGSSRLPGKVLFDLAGMPVIGWIITAGLATTLVDDICIATSTDPRDDIIEEFCNAGHKKISCFRGSEDDVLQRFVGAAHAMKADVAIRVTCDCPFIDPSVIDQVVALREATNADYVGNIDPPTWPDGLDCEAITIKALEVADKEATSKIDRDCVTTFITSRRQRFHCETLVCPLPGMHKERWVLDTENDWKLCQAIAMMEPLPRSWVQIKQYLDANPKLRELNNMHPRNERLYQAMAEESVPRRRWYTKSKELLRKAEEFIPLGAQTFSKSKIQYPADSPFFLTHGDGGWCYDVDGNRYVDLVGGLLPVILGHRDPDVDYAVRRQQSRGVCFSLATEIETELSRLLCSLIPCAEMVRFGKNGSDVTSAAVRLARVHTGREYIISSGYHGWHDWAVVNDPVRNLGVPEQSVINIKHGDKKTLWEWTKRYKEIAALIIEPETDPAFLTECRHFCDNTGALLIFDEIITGFRFSLGGAQKFYDITPDLACFGKSMGNGYPISALVGKRDIMKNMVQTSYSGTFFGDTIGIAAALATIRKLQETKGLNTICEQQKWIVGEVERIAGNDSVFAITHSRLPRLLFPDNNVKTLFVQEMAKAGVLIIASHNLSLAHGKSEVNKIISAYQHVCPVVAKAIKAGKVQNAIHGRSIPAHANVRAEA